MLKSQEVNFEKLILPSVSIAGLYSKSLIVEQGEKSAKNTPGENKINTGYSFLGPNSARICLLVNLPGDKIVPEKQLTFIARLLSACKLSMEEVVVLNHYLQPIEVKKLKQQLNPDRILLFGLSPSEIELPVNFPMFMPQTYDGTTYLYAPSLTQLNQENEEGKLLKSKLWVCLRQVFQF